MIKCHFREKSVLGGFKGFPAEMGFETWRIRIGDPFYMQISLRTPLIEAEISKIAKIAIPTMDTAIGNVDKDFIGLSLEPIIPLKNTVTGAAVNAKI